MQEKVYPIANSNVSQNSHLVFNLSVFTLEEYLQNPIKIQPRKLLFITQLSIISRRFKDNTGFTTLQTLVNPSIEACWKDYCSISHWTVVDADGHHTMTPERKQPPELHFLQTWILGRATDLRPGPLWTLTRKA